MSSTTCFTSKGHSTRIAPPCGSYHRDTERFGLKILFAGLLFVLLFGLFTVPVAAWEADTSWYDESESEFIISTAPELLGLSKLVNDGNSFSGKTVILNTDIDLSVLDSEWVSIGSSLEYPFSGNFEGNGYTISNLEKTVFDNHRGLFGYICNSTVNNCSLVSITLDSSDDYVGVLAGHVENSSINNCHLVDCSIDASGSQYIGIVAGYASNVSIMNSTVNNCISDGQWYVGGIFGKITNAITITNCSVSDSTICGYYDVGGVAGEASDCTSSICDCILYHSSVTGNYAGGIIGYSFGENINYITNITIDSSSITAGNGAVGGVFGSGSGNIYDSIMSNSMISGHGYVGGVAGSLSGNLDNCSVNFCTIEGSAGYVGGISGLSKSVSNCFVDNSTVSSTTGDYIGGISGSSSINYCSVTNSTVGSTGDYIGGISGSSTSISYSSVGNCSISGTSYVGGISSYCGYYSGITNCFVNGGNISGISYVGGIVGFGGEITNCYSCANISGTSYVGGIIGGVYGSINNCLSLGQFMGDELSDVYRIGNVGFDDYSDSCNYFNNYAWEGMKNAGISFSEGGINGTSVSPSQFWNNQGFFEDTLGWDFEHTWKMNTENDNYQLPVLKYQSTPVSGNVSYLRSNEAEPTPDSYVLVFDANGGTGSMTSATVSAGDSYTLPECVFTAPAGQVFNAWQIGSEEYAVGETYTPTESVTIKALWVDAEIPTLGDFTIEAPYNEEIITEEGTITVIWTESTGATGYKFALRDITFGEGEKLIDNVDIGNVQTYPIDEAHLTSGFTYRFAVCAYNENGGEKWIESVFSYYPDTCVISFDANGGSGSQVPILGSSGKSYALPECTFTVPDGQKFKAWLIGSTEYQPGDYYTPTDSITVKAVWTATDVPAPGSFTINPLVNGVVSWTASEGATGYKFSLRDRTISETEDIGKKVNNKDVGDTLSYDISSYLVDGHAYRVAVCAYNDAGKETWAELEFGDCQHTNLVDVNINYKGITKDFPQNAGDGTHYWYVNVVCDDCDAVQQENVKRTAEHNANTLEKNGVCECNYHRYETGLSYTMYAIEDATTYLVPEAEDGYRGGSIDKEEEVTVFSDRLGTDKSWSLIKYSVTGTSREKVRFVKSDVLVDTLEKGSITITYPNENTPLFYERDGEDLSISLVSSGSISSCQLKVGIRYVYGPEIDFEEVYSDSFDINIGSNTYLIPIDSLTRELTYFGKNPETYEIIISGFDNKGRLIDEATSVVSIMHVFDYNVDTWSFYNAKDILIDFTVVDGDTQKFRWEDFSAVFGNDEISQEIYKKTEYGGSCFSMVTSLIQLYTNTLPIDGFDGGIFYSPKNIYPAQLKKVTHEMFDVSTTKNLGDYIMQLQLYQNDVNVQDRLYSNGRDKYDEIISTIQNGNLVGIHMVPKLHPSSKQPEGWDSTGNHCLLGYDVEFISKNDEEYINVHVYDPNYVTSGYLQFTQVGGSDTYEWEYYADYLDDKKYIYNSDYHNIFYLSEEDDCELFNGMFNGQQIQFKHPNELVYIKNTYGNKFGLGNDKIELTLVDRNGNSVPSKEYIFSNDGISQTSITLYRIPKEEIQLLSTDGGTAVIVDDHSSVELTLDAGTTASVIVDDTKENSVEITSDDENTNHEFTVTYGYDSTADKGYQEATIKGTMSDSFNGEATENGLKLTGLDSAEILVENSKGESVSVGTIQNADEYEDIVIDIDTSVKVTGNKDGVSDVLVSVPLNKVQYESSGSSKDTGSGNYAEYPRIVTNGGYVDFGTSPVVKGITLPEGVSGKVVLIAKSKTPAPEGKEAYGVFEINVASYPTGEKAVISFTIPLSDLQKKGCTEKDICLYHFDGEVWTKLLTTYTVEGDKVFYEAETTAFSPFAIVYEKDGATSAAVSEIPVEPEKPSDETVSTVPEIPSSSEPQETESPAPVLGMMLGGLGAAVLMRRK